MTARTGLQMHGRGQRVAAAIAALALVGMIGACSAATPGSTATALGTARPPGTTTSAGTATPPVIATDGSQATRVDTVFESARYRYRLIVPPGWTINEAPGSGGLHPDEPGVDTFRDREGHILSVIGEPADQLDGWVSAIDGHLRGEEHRLTAESEEPLTIAGVPGSLRAYRLQIPPSYVIHYLDAALVSDGVGRVLSLESTTRDDPGDLAVLDSFLSTLELGSP